jgi:hypothetical protein
MSYDAIALGLELSQGAALGFFGIVCLDIDGGVAAD